MIKRTFPIVLSAAALLALVGCTGQGNYTREGVSMAKERMSFLKSATEWELARQAFLAGDLEKALRKVDTSLEINDTVVKSHVLKGRVLIEMGDLGNALQSLQTAAALDPEEPDAHYYLAIVYERINEPELACQHFMTACEFDDYNPVSAVAAAEMMIDLGRVDEAKAYLNSIPMAENIAGIRQSLGHIALIEQDAEVAVDYFSQARLLAPDDSIIAENLIHAQAQAGQWGDAEKNIARLIKKEGNGERKDLKVLHAQALMHTGRAVDARSIYQQIVTEDEGRSDVDSWIGLANASMMIGDLRTVRKAATRVISLEPSSPEGFTLYAMYHRENGDDESALKAIETAIDKNPGDPVLYALCALIQRDLDMPLKALASVTQATELDPANPQFARMLTAFTRGAGEAFASSPTYTE